MSVQQQINTFSVTDPTAGNVLYIPMDNNTHNIQNDYSVVITTSGSQVQTGLNVFTSFYQSGDIIYVSHTQTGNILLDGGDPGGLLVATLAGPANYIITITNPLDPNGLSAAVTTLPIPVGGIADSVINVSTAQGAPTLTFDPTFLVLINPTNKFNFDPATAGLAEGSAFYMSSTASMPGGLSAYTKYYVVNSTASDFQIAATFAGPAITITSLGSGFISIYTSLAVSVGDPWKKVLDTIDLVALDYATVVPAMDAAPTASALNPFVTESTMVTTIEDRKGFLLIGPPGSGADFEGTDQTPFTAALAQLGGPGRLYVLAGTYTFTATVIVPSDVHIVGSPGVSPAPPLATLIVSSGNFPAFSLPGIMASLDWLDIQAPFSTTSSVVQVLGQKSLITRCLINNFTYVGLQVGGYRNKVSSCSISSSTAASVGVVLQNTQNVMEFCSFSGLLANGAVKIEGSACGVFSSFFANTITGYSYLILSSSVQDARLVSNHFDAPLSLNLSFDYGTGSVRYGNTPNTLILNQNNFLEPLAEYTGQPLIASTAVTLTEPVPYQGILGFPFAIATNNLTAIDGELGDLIQKNYEERNYFLESSVDPTYDSFGAPVTGQFSWDGTNLTFPQFHIRSVLNRTARWVINAGSVSLAAGQVLYVTIDQSLSGIDIVLTPTVAAAPLPLLSTSDTQYKVLAAGLGGGAAAWLEGFRLLPTAVTFDIDGTPLPIVQFIGASEVKNTPLPPSMFGGAANASLTDKLSAHSAQLKSLYEHTNVSFEPLTADAEFSTDPTPGPWLTTELIGLPSATPTHILEHRTHTYGLDPIGGLYRYDFSNPTRIWVSIAGNPLAGPFTALSTMSTGLALLQTDGKIAYYDANTGSWLSYIPTIAAGTATPFASVRPGTFPVGGQADYSLQTEHHTYFKTLSGDVVRYSLVNNFLETVPHIYTEDVGDSGLLSHSLKDTGFNTLRDPDTQFESLDTGISYTTGLPVGYKSTMLAFDDTAYAEFKSVDFSQLIFENFAFDTSSGAWISLYRNAGTTKWYVFGGGRDRSYLYATLASTAPEFSDFTPMHWVVNAQKQEVFALGKKTSTGAFASLHGYIDISTNAWLWVNQVSGAANTCQGCVGVFDYYPGGVNRSDLWALVSVPAGAPVMWKRDGVSGTWTSNVMASSAASFNYVRATDPLKAFGAASPLGIGFLATDGSRANRPILFHFNRSTSAYSVTTLGDTGATVTLPAATANSATKFYGAAFHQATQTVYYVVRDNITTTRLFAHHVGSLTLTLWSGVSLAATGLAQSFINRSGNQVGVNNLQPVGTTPILAYLLTNDGISTITLTGSGGGFTSASLSTSSHTTISGVPGFSSTNISPYLPQVGGFRGGEPSVTIGTWTEDNTFPVQGAGFGGDPDLGGGIFWSEPGTNVKNLGDNLWAGINRGGYLWVANASQRTRQTELTPNPATVRGDITVVNLGTLTDFDFAINPSNQQIGFIYRDTANANRMAFLLWDTVTGTIVAHERAGNAPFNPPGSTLACGSPPRIAFNAYANTWDVVVQDDSRLGGQTSFFRRPATSTAWQSELLGPAGPGIKTLPTMVAQAGRSPSKPSPQTNGDVVVASQVGALGDLLVFYRQAISNSWLTSTGAGIGPLGSTGFVAPELSVATTGVLGIPITPAPPFSPKLRITLTWGANPADLDAHITFPDSISGRDHVAYYNLSQDGTTLDVDDTDGFGPEIISSTTLNNGVYRYSVHDYSGTGTLATSSAVVTLEVNGVVIDTRSPPVTANNPQDLWRVWDITVSGGEAVAYTLINDVVPNPQVEADFHPPTSVAAAGAAWVFGSSNGTVASIASSASYLTGFTLFTNPLATAYNRVTSAKIFAYSDSIAIVSPLATVGATPANQEMGVFTVSSVGAVTAKFFAAMGRTQSAQYSGEEETTYGNHSWSYNGALVYGATRPGRANPHFSVRVSRNKWLNLGDSALGSGRLLTIGDRCYREEFADDPNNSLIYEFDIDHNAMRTWMDLPIAERDTGNFTALRYPYAADGAPSSLFRTGNPTDGMVSDATLSSGSLPAVTSRGFPLIEGSTRIQGGVGAGVLYNGGMAVISASYLPTVGTASMLKLAAQNTLTMKGSFAIKVPNDVGRVYTLTGPLVFNLPDAPATSFGHLVLQFPTAGTLTLDTLANPLSYWTDLNYPQTTITIVLGEVREKAFVLYPIAKMNSRAVKLTYGTLELADITEDLALVSYCAPVSQYCITKVLNQKFEVTPVAIDSVTVKKVGALQGFQKLQFPTPGHLLVAGGLPPNNTGFYYYTNTNETVSGEGQMRIEHIAGKYVSVVVFNT